MSPCYLPRFRLLVTAVALLGFIGDAHAADFIYSYVGGNYMKLSGPGGGQKKGNCLKKTMHVSATIALSTALPPNFSGKVSTLSWQVSDGAHIWSGTGDTGFIFASFNFTTDQNAEIVGWSFTADDYQTSQDFLYQVSSDSSTGKDDASDTVCHGTEYGLAKNGAWSQP